MKEVRVLWLDDAANGRLFERKVQRSGLPAQLRLVQSEDYSDYAVTRANLDSISSLVKNDAFHLVVIGNNLGAGIPRAAEVPESLRGRTFVIWYDILWGYDHPYAKLGYTLFAERRNLAERIRPIIF